jgi:hypothetical protein
MDVERVILIARRPKPRYNRLGTAQRFPSSSPDDSAELIKIFDDFDAAIAAPQAGGPAPVANAVLVVGGFESRHPLGAQFAFGDDSVRFLYEMIDLAVYRRMGHRADGELIDDR